VLYEKIEAIEKEAHHENITTIIKFIADPTVDLVTIIMLVLHATTKRFEIKMMSHSTVAKNIQINGTMTLDR